MFVCSSCCQANGWPETYFRSRGACEECGRQADCSSIPSALLPRTIITIQPPAEETEGE